jgi:hypothetical protein
MYGQISPDKKWEKKFSKHVVFANNVLGKNCFGQKLFWAKIVLGKNCFGQKLFWV